MDVELLKELLDAFGISGKEGDIRTIIVRELKRYASDFYTDKLGNLIVHFKGKPPKVMLAAHMDEIGLMVKNIDKIGRIHISSMGGIEPFILVGQRVRIKSTDGMISGIVTLREISDSHLLPKTLPKMKDLIVDTGLTKEELLAKQIDIGSYLSFEQHSSMLGSDNIISGKALDDRAGCFVLIELIKTLKKIKNELYVVFTVQEELGLYGAKTSTYEIEPDWAIVIDATNANDCLENATKFIGGGPCLTIKDTGMLSNPCITSWLRGIAKKLNIPVQLEVSNFGTTDALSISVTKGGVPCSVLCIPVRNLHSTIGIAHLNDIRNAIKLLTELLKDPPKVCIV